MLKNYLSAQKLKGSWSKGGLVGFFRFNLSGNSTFQDRMSRNLENYEELLFLGANIFGLFSSVALKTLRTFSVLIYFPLLSTRELYVFFVPLNKTFNVTSHPFRSFPKYETPQISLIFGT